MILINKAAVGALPLVGVLLVFQNSATILFIVWNGGAQRPKLDRVWEWLPQAVLFCTNIFSSLMTLQVMSVPSFTVLRNLQPILAICIEFWQFGEAVSTRVVLALVFVFIGAILYCIHDIYFNMTGLAWSVVHILSMTMYAVLVRKVASGGKSEWTAQQMSLYNNLISLPLLLPLVFWQFDQSLEHLQSCSSSIYCVGVVLASCVGGFCVSVAGFAAQKVLSATGWLTLNNISKIPAILLSYYIWGGDLGVFGAIGMLVSLGAGYVYSLEKRQSGLGQTSCTTLAITTGSLVGLCLSASFHQPSVAKSGAPWHQTFSFAPMMKSAVHPLDPGSKCVFWGTTTTIFDPSPAVLQFLSMEGSCLVVVGDKKTRDGPWRELESRHGNPKLVFLGAGNQTTLPYSIVKRIPWNHFGQKNIAYLYAIHHGAEMVYDWDDDNHLLEPLQANLLFSIRNCVSKARHNEAWQLRGLRLFQLHMQHHQWNPYPAFCPSDKEGQPRFLWPRGQPLSSIRDNKTFSGGVTESQQLLNNCSKIGVFQSLANHNPDVDAIYRMVGDIPIYFRGGGDIRVLPKGTFAPWNAQATLITKRALWGLLLPVSVTGRVSDIWRSYITSRLMWDGTWLSTSRLPSLCSSGIPTITKLIFKTN